MQAKKSGKSPYQKYGKTPFKYTLDCSHASSVKQSISANLRDGTPVHWSGKVCTRCNHILANYDPGR